MSSGFSVYSNPHGGYVEFYTRGDSRTWKTNIDLPGTCLEFVLLVWYVESVAFNGFWGCVLPYL